jgi:hypothetical protein
MRRFFSTNYLHVQECALVDVLVLFPGVFPDV